MQTVERVGNSGGIAPESCDDVTVVHGVLWLDARGKSQLRKTWNVAFLEHLGMLDGAVRVGTFRAVEHDGVRFVADGMAGDVEAMFGGEPHIRFDLLGGVAQRAVGFRRNARIRCGAVGGSGVERAVGNHLHRTDMAQAMASGKFVAGMPAVVDGLLKSFGVNAGFDAQSVKPLLEAVNPRVDVLGHLIVAHADHAFAGGVLFRVAQQSHQLVSRTGAFVQLAVSVEPFKLADESRLAYMHAELTSRG